MIERAAFVLRHDVQARRMTDSAEFHASCRKLDHARRQLTFLRSIADGSGGADPQCPVCLNEWGKERMIAACGHSICLTCSERITAAHGGTFVCSICRSRGSLAMATDMQADDGSAAGTRVLGSWGTKVTAITEQVMALPEGDKCLVFSQWDEMLDIVAAALKTNSVQVARLGPQGKLDAALDLFKRDAAVRALLLPLGRGANGINLTAAQVCANYRSDVHRWIYAGCGTHAAERPPGFWRQPRPPWNIGMTRAGSSPASGVGSWPDLAAPLTALMPLQCPIQNRHSSPPHPLPSRSMSSSSSPCSTRRSRRKP